MIGNIGTTIGFALILLTGYAATGALLAFVAALFRKHRTPPRTDGHLGIVTAAAAVLLAWLAIGLGYSTAFHSINICVCLALVYAYGRLGVVCLTLRSAAWGAILGAILLVPLTAALATIPRLGVDPVAAIGDLFVPYRYTPLASGLVCGVRDYRGAAGTQGHEVALLRPLASGYLRRRVFIRMAVDPIGPGPQADPCQGAIDAYGLQPGGSRHGA